MLILNSGAVQRALPMDQAIKAMRRALVAISSGQVCLPPRTHLDSSQHDGTTLVMPGRCVSDQGDALAVKVVSVFNNNRQRGLANILGVVNVFDPQTGALIAVLDGAAVTAIRTAAASAVATDLLARADASRLAVIGAGAQAKTHLQAICAVRNISDVKIYSRSMGKAAELAAEFDSMVPIATAETAEQAVRNADIVCAVTNSQTPVFQDSAICPGTHINAIGSYKPQVVEIPAETIVRSRVYVDHRESVWSEAGDLIQPLQRHEIDKQHIVGEIGQLIGQQVAGRSDDQQLTLYKSVGNTAQDVIAAQVIVKNALARRLGQQVDF